MAMSSGGGSRLTAVTADINVTPMADIMLVLLIIFMITTPLLQEGIYVNMAKAQNPQVAQGVSDDDSTTVALTRDDKTYISIGTLSAEISSGELQQKLADALEKSSNKPLFVRSDIAVKYGKVVEVVNKAREAGWERIGLMVDREETAATPRK